MTRCLARELSSRSVRVNAISCDVILPIDGGLPSRPMLWVVGCSFQGLKTLEGEATSHPAHYRRESLGSVR